MINFNNILKYADKFEKDLDDVFNVSLKHERTTTIYEDSDVVVALTLTYQQSKTHSRWFYPTIRFKNYNNISKDGMSVKITNNLLMSQNLEDVTLRELVETCLNSCNVNNIEDINFTYNGYTLEVVKTSSKYITVCEHINAVRFTKRFDSLETLFNYINYRKKLHKLVKIGVNVSDVEIDNIKRSISVLKNNANALYVEMLSIIQPIRKRFVDVDNIKIEYIGSKSNWSEFVVSYVDTDNDIEIKIECLYNTLSGIKYELPSDIKTDDMKYTEYFSILLEIISELEQTASGLLSRYFTIIEQKRKYLAKIVDVDIKTDIKQLNPYDVTSDVYDAFIKARAKESMESTQVNLTKFGGYRRYIQLDGVMKNRKRCDLVVFAKSGKEVFEEYRLQIEKNRLVEEVQDFLKSYFN